MRFLALALLVVSFSSLFADSMWLSPLPPWTNKYGDSDAYRTYYDWNKLMKTHGLSRPQAAELQNELRTRTQRDGRLPTEAEVTEAATLARTQNRVPFRSDALAKADFIVVFDLDETLYDQYTATSNCRSYSFTTQAGKAKHIHLAPFADDIIRGINKLGGAVVIFSAGMTPSTMENLKHWPFEGVTIADSPKVAGLLFNDHLAQFGADEKPSPVVIASKDLRIFDESLSKVIIVDDNPTKLFQPRQHRLTKKFFAKQYCTGDASVKKAFDEQLPQVAQEIEESVKYQRAHKVSFTTAYLPYTMIGQVSLTWLRKANHWTDVQARDYLRQHPEAADPAF